jgi:hypothetical protein
METACPLALDPWKAMNRSAAKMKTRENAMVDFLRKINRLDDVLFMNVLKTGGWYSRISQEVCDNFC